MWEYDRGRPSRAASYTGFVDLAQRGTLVTDSKYDYDDVTGRLFWAFSPLFTDDSVYT